MAIMPKGWQSNNVNVEFSFNGATYNLGVASSSDSSVAETRDGSWDKSGTGAGIRKQQGGENSDQISLTFQYLTDTNNQALLSAYESDDNGILTLSQLSDASKRMVMDPASPTSRLYVPNFNNDPEDKVTVTFYGKFTTLDQGQG